MTASTIPDILPAIKTWLGDLGIFNGVYYRLPANVEKNGPLFVRISRAGGGPGMDSEVPVATLRVTVEVWGLANSDYEAVRGTAVALEQAVHAVNGPNALGPGVIALGMNVLTGYDSPDPDTGWPRYIVMLSVTARSA